MNICGNGICVCDNYEYGESGCSDMNRDIIGEAMAAQKDWRYYFDTEYGVVLSVEPHEMIAWIDYYYDPDLTKRVE